MSENFYTTLGLPPAATRAQVKAAYLAALDRAASRADIDRLHAAYWILINPRLRGMHDAELAGPTEVGAELRALRKSELRDLANAAARLGNLARAHPYPALLRVAGILLFGTEQFPKARRVFQRLCELEPGDGEALCFLAQCLEKEGRHAEADRLVERMATLEPLEPMACQELAKKRLFKEMDAQGTLAVLDRGLAGGDGSASGRLPLLASLFLPLMLLDEERRREETAEAFLELLPRARISIQQGAMATVHSVAKLFPPEKAPKQNQWFRDFLRRLVSYIDRFTDPDPQAEALEQERARLEADSSAPDWIRRLARTLDLLPAEHPRNRTEESPAEENAATFQACVRLEQRQAEWAGFAQGYPVLAGRIPGAFEPDDREGAERGPGRLCAEDGPSLEAGASEA